MVIVNKCHGCTLNSQNMDISAPLYFQCVRPCSISSATRGAITLEQGFNPPPNTLYYQTNSAWLVMCDLSRKSRQGKQKWEQFACCFNRLVLNVHMESIYVEGHNPHGCSLKQWNVIVQSKIDTPTERGCLCSDQGLRYQVSTTVNPAS